MGEKHRKMKGKTHLTRDQAGKGGLSDRNSGSINLNVQVSAALES